MNDFTLHYDHAIVYYVYKVRQCLWYHGEVDNDNDDSRTIHSLNDDVHGNYGSYSVGL